MKFKRLDIENWNRKEHFLFLKAFEEPFFGFTVLVDVTKAYEYCKATQQSFFLYYLYQSLKAANTFEVFKYRIKNDEVHIFEEVFASATIMRANDTFGFSYMEFKPTFEAFKGVAEAEIARIQTSTSLMPEKLSDNLIHYSSIPWVNFSSVSHARSFSYPDSCPKITFGKITKDKDTLLMPVSIHVHHALMDGRDVGLYLDYFQQLLNNE